MSTPQPAGVKAGRPAERALFHGLFGDAAVFPPGLAPLPRAVTEHRARQSRSYGDLVGPLLLPASAAGDLLALGPTVLEAGLDVALVSRPGGSAAVLDGALSRLHDHAAVSVVGVELGWSPGWHDAATGRAISGNAALSVEVPRGVEQERALSDIQAHADSPNPVQAKLRTGSTPDQPAPTSTELAMFIRACVDHDLSFKLTGGLHHAITATTPAGQDQLGFLNVLVATRWALAHGAEVPEMGSLLRQRDPAPILDIITRMSLADVSVLRAFFTSFGCCRVIDPIGDLADLGLIRETAV